MQPRITYIHIPKAAGSSQCAMFEDIFGKAKVYWWPRVDGKLGDTYIDKESDLWSVTGGHIPIVNYDQSRLTLYLSLLRDPVERVISLFNYYTQPSLAVEEFERSERQRLLDLWTSKGIVPESLELSLENCDEFRGQCSNEQCRYLSIYEPTFDGVLRTFSEKNIIVGTMDKIDEFNFHIRDFLGTPHKPSPHINKSREVVEKNNNVEELIKSINSHDLKLYKEIKSLSDGYYSNIKDRKVLTFYLSTKNPEKLTFDDWKNVYIKSPETTSIIGENEIIMDVEIINDSNIDLPALVEGGLNLSYHVYDRNNNCTILEGSRQPITDDIKANTSRIVKLKLNIQKKYLDTSHRIKCGLLYEGKLWFEDMNPEHLSSTKIITPLI